MARAANMAQIGMLPLLLLLRQPLLLLHCGTILPMCP
jgi:hypothetical protein